MEIAVFRVSRGRVVLLSEEMEYALTFVVKGDGSHLAVLQLELRHTFEGGQRQLGFKVGVVGIVASPYLLNDAGSLSLPLIAYGNGGAVIAQFGHLKERTSHDALKLGIAIEVDVRSFHALVVRAYGDGMVRSQIAEYVNSAVGAKVFQFDVEVGLVVMTLRESLVIHVFRRDDIRFRLKGRVGIGDARHRTRLALKRDISSRHDGNRLREQFTKLRSGFHREVLEERHYLVHRAVLEPFGFVRSSIDGFVGGKIARKDGMALKPVALHRAVVAGRREYALQEDVVILLRTHLLLLLVLAVDVEKLGGINDNGCGQRGITRHSHIYVFLSMGVEHCGRGLQRPSAVVVSRVVADDALDVDEDLRSAYA